LQKKSLLVYPHHIFEVLPHSLPIDSVYLIEEPLFFRQYKFHKQKLCFHRVTLKKYEVFLKKHYRNVHYVESASILKTEDIGKILKADSIQKVYCAEPFDNWLKKRIIKSLTNNAIEFEFIHSQAFFSSLEDIENYNPKNKKFYFTDFYIQQRKKHSVLVDRECKPEGGKWSFDNENRRKLPSGIVLPRIVFPTEDTFVQEGKSYIQKNFPDNPGVLDTFIYPTDFRDAKKWCDQFFEKRFFLFGDYEDAIAQKESILFHSLLSSLINVGLITPYEIIDKALKQKNISLNSLEGFIRQVLGWREYVLLTYMRVGIEQRTCNFWNFSKKMPKSLYKANTGIEPVDHTIHKIMQSGYCHHIERLMILGNFMLLCEIHPDEVYRWFMELFIDAYDWVMVPNVYGMSQYSDGGLITTKPYVSGSAYILKMSDYRRGEWCRIWDALYWRFIYKHSSILQKNPRMKMMISMLTKMGNEKLNEHLRIAEKFLEVL
jgi:deoxyribodipyrimidine photolyase-related protein